MIIFLKSLIMSLNKYVIIVNILSEITNVVYVMAEPRTPTVTVGATSSVSKDMVSIAGEICSDLLFNSEVTDLNDEWFARSCEENFLNGAVFSSSPPGLQWCRREDGVSFKLSSTEAPWRLVVQIPDDDTFTDIINYSLMESHKSFGTIPTVAGATYTMWTTALSETGEHSLWLRGPQILPWKVTNETYHINVEMQFEDISKSTVKAKFRWDRDDAKTTCYNVMSSCDNMKIVEDTVWLNEEDEEVSWEVRNLAVDVSCELRVSGSRGTDVKHYRTECEEMREPKGTLAERNEAKDFLESDKQAKSHERIASEFVKNQENAQNVDLNTTKSPEAQSVTVRINNTPKTESVTATPTKTSRVNLDDKNPHNVTLMATESAGNGWDVVVDWVPPKTTPDRYNVTLVGSHMRRTVLVPGNVTEAIVRNVEDEGFYYVIIETVIGKKVSHTSRDAIFPEKSNVTGLVTSVAVLAVVIVMVGGFIHLRSRRADKMKRSYFVDLDEKPSKDALEAFDVESSRTEEYWEVGSRRLLLHEVVGEGAFGVVRRGTLAGEEVAVKMLKDFPTQDEIRSFHAEIELMRLMQTVGRHAHVLGLVECRAGRRPLILTEYCNGGDLLSYLRCIWDVMVSKRKAKYYNNNIESCEYRNDLFKCKFEGQNSKLVVNKLYDLQGICDTELTSRDLLSFCRQIAMGMDFLASNKVVHRDLAARNILVAKDRTLKIADFGLSRDVYEENQYKQKGNGKMPVKWMALESLERKIYTTKSDVWSFGVVVWEIVTVGGSPYPDVPPARLLRFLREGYRMQRPYNCSRELYSLMLWCWRASPGARPSFAALRARLDALLAASATHYLALEMGDDRPAARSRYVRLIKEKLGWSRSESNSSPCRAVPVHNHYSSPPSVQPA